MRHFKTIKNGYIQTIGTGHGGIEISEEEYKELYGTFMNCPIDTGCIYELNAETLTWEQTGTYSNVEDSAMSETEEKAMAFDILMGVGE